jgi:hypothetical protein
VTHIARNVLARGFDGDELRYSTSRALDRLARRGAPVADGLLAWLERWLRDPLPQDIQDESSAVGDLDDGGDAGEPAPADEEHGAATEQAGFERSSIWGHGELGDGYPGGSLPIADALVSIRLARGEADQATATLSRFLEREKGIRQWEVLSRHLLKLGGVAGGPGETLIGAVLSEVPGVVGSRRFAQFLADAQRAHHDLVEHHLDVWRNDGGVVARQAYGELVALDALLRPERDDSRRRFDNLMEGRGPSDAQVGAALTAAHLLAEEPDRRVEASRALVALLALPNPVIWSAAFEFFRLADRLVPDEGTVAFLRAVAEGLHRSGNIDPTFVVDGLATMLPHEASLVGEIALTLTEKWSAELADVRTATAKATLSLVDLAVTLHRLGPETRDVGLKIFEQLIDVDAYEARQTLNEIDGRFLETPSRPRRPRLRRRSQVLPRRRWGADAMS